MAWYESKPGRILTQAHHCFSVWWTQNPEVGNCCQSLKTNQKCSISSLCRLRGLVPKAWWSLSPVFFRTEWEHPAWKPGIMVMGDLSAHHASQCTHWAAKACSMHSNAAIRCKIQTINTKMWNTCQIRPLGDWVICLLRWRHVTWLACHKWFPKQMRLH